MAQQIVIIDGLIPGPWLCIQETASGSIMQNVSIAFLLMHYNLAFICRAVTPHKEI